MTLRKGNNYIEEMLGPSDSSDALPIADSEIAQFFAGLNVLITGATGFMGKLLVEKLLRSCPGISTLYVIVRAKKGKDPQLRFNEIFDDIVYTRLQKEQPNFFSKVVMLEGDTGLEDLGLSPENRALLLNTHIIFHGAATVRFDEKLRNAANINVRGPKQLLLFAKEMPHLKGFVHISTAFSYCVLKSIDEKHFTPPIDGDDLLKLMHILNDEQLEHITPILLGKWPNTYAFTKAIAENIVLKHSTGIPTCIVRPSIVISTAKEPMAGWTNNMYGATGVCMGSGVGLIRVLHCLSENIADIMPADYVIANIIAAGWDIAKRGEERKSIPASITNSEPAPEIADIERVPVYNSVSSCQNPISWGQFMKLNEIHGSDVPSTKQIWVYMFTLQRYLLVYKILVFLLHYIPGAIIDALLYLSGRKPMLLSAYKKIHKFSGVIHYFSTQEWRFRNENVVKLWDKLSPVDRQIFNFNMKNLKWDEYFFYHIRGLRVYMLKDPMDTLEEGRAIYRRRLVMHYTVIALLFLLGFWIFVSFYRFVWSYCPLSQ